MIISLKVASLLCLDCHAVCWSLCAGCYARTVEVLDVGAMKVVSTIEDAHARPVHTIVQSPSSLYVSHPKEAYELFATAACDNCIKLWDVRVARWVCPLVL